MKITVSQDHINRGVRQDTCACPIALAVSEALPKDNRDTVTVRNSSNLYIGEDWVPIDDDRVKDFIIRFDANVDPKWLEPFDFELDYAVEEKE